MADEKKPSRTEIYFGNVENPAIFLHTPGVIYMQSPDIRLSPPTKIKWNDQNDSYTKTVEFEGEIITSEYKLTIINKDTDKEEVTKLTLPDGSVINFEGWIV